MNRKEPSQNPLFHVVINNEGQYSLWPAGEKIPPGWQKTAFAGNKEECLAFIQREWTDMTPRSLREFAPDPSARTYQDNQQDGLAHHFFVEQAAKTPDAIAVVFKDQQITYKDLHHYSNQIGNYLQEIGVTPEKAVGLCVGRSIEMIAGFLGILKSGGVYVPLDPLYPAERLKTMIHESHLTALLVQEEFLADLAVTTACICSIDRDRELIAKKSIENVESPITPQNLSHIIFTSGSTGTPKGVMMPHATLSANLTGFMDKVKIHPEDRYLHTASLAFTSSLRQILAPLSCGARIVIADQEQRTNPLALFTLINTEKVTIWDTVAPFWETCTKSLLQKSPATRNEFLENSLRLILSSGGELPRSLIQTWRELSAKKVRLLNMYGQTETVGNILI
ncbi:MAG: AMP-binding protein, partial [Proteobacteria bacterium]|nr:AMP-binding protein [Pseudomonadota bacterium]